MATESHGWIGTEIVNTRFGDFEFKNGYPTPEAADKLYEWLKFNRAVESYLHFVTIVSMFHMQKGLTNFGLDAANKFLIFETLLDAQSLYLTPNTESIYGMQFLDLKRDGPTIVEAPPGLMGGFSTMWQEAVIYLGPTGRVQRPGGQRRWLDGRLLRPASPQRKGEELDQDGSGQRLVPVPAVLQPDPGVL